MMCDKLFILILSTDTEREIKPSRNELLEGNTTGKEQNGTSAKQVCFLLTQQCCLLVASRGSVPSPASALLCVAGPCILPELLLREIVFSISKCQ